MYSNLALTSIIEKCTLYLMHYSTALTSIIEKLTIVLH